MRGVFIALEGLDGSGKSTVAEGLARYVDTMGMATVLTREPGGTEFGRAIRHLLLDRSLERQPITELLMMCADRAEHVQSVIQPALARGNVVITDRYAASTRAYQGAGLGVDAELVERAIWIATGGLEPDLTLLLDVDVDVAQKRRHARPDAQNDIDRRSLEFHERVRAGFLVQAMRHPQTWVIVNASQSTDAVVADAMEAIGALVASKGAG